MLSSFLSLASVPCLCGSVCVRQSWQALSVQVQLAWLLVHSAQFSATIVHAYTATLLYRTSLRVMAPSLLTAETWLRCPLQEDLRLLLRALPQGTGVASDVVWALSLPVLKCLLMEKREQYSASAMDALEALSSASRASTAGCNEVRC